MLFLVFSFSFLYSFGVVTIYSVKLFVSLKFKPSEDDVVKAPVPVGILAISSAFLLHAPENSDKTRSKINT